MKPRVALLALMLAFPFLYLSGALFQSRVGSVLTLLFVAAVCLYLLKPDGKV
jgi:hypothetical protein